MEKTYITRRQFFTILYAYMLSNELTRGTYILYFKQSTWIPVLLSFPIAVLIFFIYSYIYKNNNYTDFKTSIEKIVGKFFAKAIFIVYLLYFLLLSFVKLRDMAEIVNIYILQDSSFWVIYGCYLLVVIYCVNKGIEVVGRYAGIIFFITFSIFIFFYILLFLVNEPKFENLLPIMPEKFPTYIYPAMKMSYCVPFGELFAMFIVFQHVRPEHKKKAFKTSYLGIATIGITMLIITITNIIFLEPEALVLGYVPIVRLWRRIDIENFIQRLDLIIVNILILNIIIKSAILFHASKVVFNGIKEIKKNKLIFFFGIAIVVFIPLIFFVPDYTKLISFRHEILMPYIKSVFEVFIPIIIVIISFLRKKQLKAETKQFEYNI